MVTKAEIAEMQRKITAFEKFKVSQAEAEKQGYDAGLNGPTTENCHFSLFASPMLTRAWERGNERGKRAAANKD